MGVRQDAFEQAVLAPDPGQLSKLLYLGKVLAEEGRLFEEEALDAELFQRDFRIHRLHVLVLLRELMGQAIGDIRPLVDGRGMPGVFRFDEYIDGLVFGELVDEIEIVVEEADVGAEELVLVAGDLEAGDGGDQRGEQQERGDEQRELRPVDDGQDKLEKTLLNEAHCKRARGAAGAGRGALI